ncbi:MAG: RICIN domain-containing protein [Clostridia bacterium]|nr:RICIN domain-containing protein [Clostridia bacterium]
MSGIKRIASVFLVVCQIMVLSWHLLPEVNAYNTPSNVKTSTAVSKLHELVSKLGDESYFNTTRTTSCGKKSSGHACSYCDNREIVKQTWFKNLFGNISVSQFPTTYYSNGVSQGPAGYSCFGFAGFAEWYIFKTGSTDKVSTEFIGAYPRTYSNCSAYVWPGDLLRLTDTHSVIVYEIASDGLKVVDCNGTGEYNCQIHYRTLSYNSTTMAISRAKNAVNDSGEGASTLSFSNHNHPTALEVGKPFSIYGTVSSNYMITQVDVWITNYDESVAYVHSTAYPNAMNYNISSMDSSVRFGDAKPGTNKYIVTAKDASGREKLLFGNRFVTYSNSFGSSFYAYIIRKNPWQRAEVGLDRNVYVTSDLKTIPKQIWYFELQQDGTYKILSAYNDMALIVRDGVSQDQTNVETANDLGYNYHRWYLCANSDDTVTLVPKFSFSKVLDVLGGGTNLQIYTPNGTNAQKFIIYPLSQEGTTYSKPNKPDKPNLTVQTGTTNVKTVFSWNTCPLKGTFDNRIYDIRIFAGTQASGTPVDAELGLTGTTFSSMLAPGTYTANVAAVNSLYYEWYTFSSNITFTVPECTHNWDNGALDPTKDTCTICGAQRDRTVYVSISPNGGVLNGSSTATIEYDVPGTKINLGTPTREGYDFTGWALDFSGTGHVLEPYGTPLHDDPVFCMSVGDVDEYNLLDNHAVTVTRMKKSSDCPSQGSEYMMEIKTAGNASPGLGGFKQLTMSTPDAVYYHMIIAKIPVGYTIEMAWNKCGDGDSHTWITSQEGTGEFQLYINKTVCGSTGSFGTFGHVYLSAADGYPSDSVTWYLSYSEIFDGTHMSGTGTTYTVGNGTGVLFATWKKGHTWDAGTVTIAPTCISSGVKIYTCTVCGGTRTETMPSLGHEFGAWIITTPATTEKEGLMTRVCSRCSAVETSVIPKKDDPNDPDPSFEVVLGDVDGDGSITASDARLVLRRAVELETYASGSREFLCCDVDRNGFVTATDARLVLRAAVKLEDPSKW